MMPPRPGTLRRLLTLTLAALLLQASYLAGPTRADRVITEDGRVLTLKKARKEGAGYRLAFEHGEILLPGGEGIRAIEIEGDMSDYVPQNEDEAKRLAEGFVRYRGRWMSKPAYESELSKEFQAAKARADEIARHSEWHTALQKETRNFVIKSNTSPELLDYYGELLEAYYALMNSRIGINPTLSYRRKKMTVNIYKSMEDFYKYSSAGVGPGTLGYFWSYDDTLNFFHDYQEPSLSNWVALHECTHLLTFLVDQQYEPQIWLNEGVADFFGSAEITRDSKGRIQIAPGLLQTDRVLTVQEAIKEDKDIKLKDLFFIDRGSYGGFEYAFGWAFVYFLNEYDKGKYQKPFQRFFRDLYTLRKGIPYEITYGGNITGTGKRVAPGDIRDLLLDALKVKDLELLEAQWKQFIAAIPIESVEARLKRGINACQRGKFSEALPDLDAVIEAGSRDPRAHAYRGMARAFTGNRSGARSDLVQAIERDPLNAAYRFQLSMLMTGGATTQMGGQGFGFRITSSSDAKKHDDPEAKALAGLATELDPRNDLYRDWYRRFE